MGGRAFPQWGHPQQNPEGTAVEQNADTLATTDAGSGTAIAAPTLPLVMMEEFADHPVCTPTEAN